MRRSLKILSAVLAAGIVLVALVSVMVVRRLDARAVAARLGEQVEATTGRALSVDSVTIRLLPHPVAQLRGLRLANAAGFDEAPFAQAESAEIGLAVLPLLLQRRLAVDSLRLHGLSLTLQREADGRDNWSDLLRAPSPPSARVAEVAGTREHAPFALASLQIDAGHVELRDARLGLDTALDALALSAEHLQRGEPFELSFGFTSDRLAALAQAQVEVSARLKIDARQTLLTTDRFRLDLHGRHDAVQAAVELAAQLRLDLDAQEFAAEKLQATLALEGTQIPLPLRRSQLEADVLYEANKPGLRVASAEWKVAGLNVNFAIDGSALDQPEPRFSGPLIIKPFKPRELLAQFGIEAPTRDPAALKEMSLRARIEAGADTASVRELVVKLDQSTLGGSLELKTDAPSAQVALKLDALDLDRYRRPPADPVAAAAAEDSAAGKPLPFDQLDWLAVAGVLDIGKLTLGGARLAGLKLRVEAPRSQDKRLIATASLYGGSLMSSTHLQRGDSGRVHESLQLAAVDFGALLADLGAPPRLSGSGDLLLDLAARGRTPAELEQSLAGDLALELGEGAVRGLNLAQSLRRTLAALHAQPFADSEAEETAFTSLQAKARIGQRQLRVDELALRSPLYRIEGTGRAALESRTLAASARITVAEALAAQSGEPLSELAGLSVPVRLSGSWDAPQVVPDLRTALLPKPGERARERMTERRPGDESLRERLLEGLDALFGRGRKPVPSPAPSPAPPSTGILQ